MLTPAVRRGAFVALLYPFLGLPLAAQQTKPDSAAPPHGIPRFPLVSAGPELEGPARPGAFLADIGRRAALLGDEGGAFEVWTWPLKLVRDLRLDFKIPEYDEPIAGGSVAQRVITRPEGATVVYSNAAFTVKEHVFAPLDEPGAIILLDVQTVRPLDVLVRMSSDFNLAWPGSFGGSSIYWDDGRHAFRLFQGGVGHYNAWIGSPFATGGTEHPAHDAPMVPSQFTLRFDPKLTTTEYIPIVIAGAAARGDSVWAVYQRLLARAPEYWRERVAHASVLRDSLLTLRSPDRRLNSALDWARINLDQALACNPDLGCGLVAGFGKAGPGNFRPGFAWFFGGDAAINSFAMSSLGQFALVRDGMSFAGKYQRADGKIAHEISQAAGRLPWFTDYPYTWYHGDTTPFWILADYEYWLASGDSAYLRTLWPGIVKAFRWSAATDADGDGLMDNPKAGAGAIEVGGLGDDLHTDIYLAGVWVAALNGVRDMAASVGDSAVARDARALFQKASASLEERFWMPSAGRYAFALLEPPARPAPGAKPAPGAGGYATVAGGFRLNDALTIWPTTAMSFRLLDPARADRMLAEISGSELTTDWGTRTLARDHRLYDPLHYNNGTVWPFVTGFVALAHYRYHRAWAGWELVRDIARTTFDFSRGHNPELMSGAFYRPLDTAVPDQYFATSMLVTPLVRGLLGLEADAPRHAVTLAPHLPAEWDSAVVSGFRVGEERLNARIVRRPGVYSVELVRTGSGGPLLVHLSPALPLGAQVRRVTIDGRDQPVRVEETPHDVHALVDVPLTRTATVAIEYGGGFEVIAPAPRVQPGDPATGLRVLDFRRDGGEFVLELEGLAGSSYDLGLRGETAPRDLRGAEAAGADGRTLRVLFPAAAGRAGFVRREVRFRP